MGSQGLGLLQDAGLFKLDTLLVPLVFAFKGCQRAQHHWISDQDVIEKDLQAFGAVIMSQFCIGVGVKGLPRSPVYQRRRHLRLLKRRPWTKSRPSLFYFNLNTFMLGGGRESRKSNQCLTGKKGQRLEGRLRKYSCKQRP